MIIVFATLDCCMTTPTTKIAETSANKTLRYLVSLLFLTLDLQAPLRDM